MADFQKDWESLAPKLKKPFSEDDPKTRGATSERLALWVKQAQADPQATRFAQEKGREMSEQEKTRCATSLASRIDVWKHPQAYYEETAARPGQEERRKAQGLLARESLLSIIEWGWADANCVLRMGAGWHNPHNGAPVGSLLSYAFTAKERAVAGALLASPVAEPRSALNNCLALGWLAEGRQLRARMGKEGMDISAEERWACALLQSAGLGDWERRGKRAMEMLSDLKKAGVPVEKAASRVFGLAARAEEVDPAALRALGSMGWDVDAADHLGATPLAQAIKERNHGSVAAFLSAGADPFKKDLEGLAPVDHARSRRGAHGASDKIWGELKEIAGARQQAEQIQGELAASRQELGAACEALLAANALRGPDGQPLTRAQLLAWANDAQATASAAQKTSALAARRRL